MSCSRGLRKFCLEMVFFVHTEWDQRKVPALLQSGQFLSVPKAMLKSSVLPNTPCCSLGVSALLSWEQGGSVLISYSWCCTLKA